MRTSATPESDIERVYLRETNRLYKRCWKFTQNAQDAEDALHLVFIKAVGAAKKPADPDEIEPWLNVIARNACLDIVRARRGHLMVDLDQREEDDERSGWDRVADRTVNVEDRLAWKELLLAAAAGLNPQERMAIELVHGDGFKRREAGLLMGLADPYPVVKSAEKKMVRKLEALAAAGEPNAQRLVRMLAGKESKQGDGLEKEGVA